MPGGKAPLRHLRFAWGKDPAPVATLIVRTALLERNAFREVLAQGGDWELRLEVTDAEQELTEYGDVEGVGSSNASVLNPGTTPPDRLSQEMTVRYAWLRGGTAVLEGTLEENRNERTERPLKGHVAAGWEDLLRKAVQDAFGAAYDARVFGSAQGPAGVFGSTDRNHAP
jgi:hypothetical protein